MGLDKTGNLWKTRSTALGGPIHEATHFAEVCDDRVKMEQR